LFRTLSSSRMGQTKSTNTREEMKLQYAMDRILIILLLLAGFIYYQHRRNEAIEFQLMVDDCIEHSGADLNPDAIGYRPVENVIPGCRAEARYLVTNIALYAKIAARRKP
jgi:hypothetical protein